MDHVRGVADQRDALGHERARDLKPERKRAPRPDRFDVAEMQPEAPLQLGVEFGVRQRDDALGLGGLLGPHDRGAMPCAFAFSGRIANGPAGRKCSSARPL